MRILCLWLVGVFVLHHCNLIATVDAALPADAVVLVQRFEEFTDKSNGDYDFEMTSRGSMLLRQRSTGATLWESEEDPNVPLSSSYFGVLQGDCHLISWRGTTSARNGVVWSSGVSIPSPPYGCVLAYSPSNAQLAIYVDNDAIDHYWSTSIDTTTGVSSTGSPTEAPTMSGGNDEDIVLMNRGGRFEYGDVIETEGYRLALESNGNLLLTLVATGEMVWESGVPATDPTDEYYVVFQSDCNWIVWAGTGPSDRFLVWKSDTDFDTEGGEALNCVVAVQPLEQQIAITGTGWERPLIDIGSTSSPSAAPTTTSPSDASSTAEPTAMPTDQDTSSPDDVGLIVMLMTTNDRLYVDSPIRVDGYQLELESDGSLVLSSSTGGGGDVVIWTNNVVGEGIHNRYYAVLQGDCNLIVREPTSEDDDRGNLVWKSDERIDDAEQCFLAVLTDEETFVIYHGPSADSLTDIDGILWQYLFGPGTGGGGGGSGGGPITYQPGEYSENRMSTDGRIFLSNGLSARPIALKGTRVSLADGSQSLDLFHIDPDGAAVIPNEDTGGWYYVSNAEEVSSGTAWTDGGVGSIEFDGDGNVIGYQRIASNTRNNCGGGRTPWGSWITCEEADFGRVYQTDPKGERTHRLTALGDLGWYESFAFDDSTEVPTFYVTRDAGNGVLTRFTPNAAGMACYNQVSEYDRWCTLENGSIDYLLISGGPSGTFTWTTDRSLAEANSRAYYYNNEGIDVSNGVLYFVAKRLKRLIILNLAAQTYTYTSTVSGAFNHQPDQVGRILGDGADNVLYFCEDGGWDAGIHGRDSEGNFYTILHGNFDTDDEETTGLAFSPNNEKMYVAYQEEGKIYEIWRDDGYSFGGATLDVKYHATSRRRRRNLRNKQHHSEVEA